MMAHTSALLLRGLPLLRPLAALSPAVSAVRFSTTAASQSPDSAAPASESPPTTRAAAASAARGPTFPPLSSLWTEGDHEYRRWKDKEEEILGDIVPITLLTKDILHSTRYMDGERLSAEDEKAVVEKLLAYHPHSEDKIGSGLDYIMVDRHPEYKNSRCLFVVRTDSAWIDFSYQKCLRAYIKRKYPSHAERFIREHYKR